MYLAIRACNQGIVKELIQKGADIHTKDNDGFTPLQYAYATHNQSIINLLAERHIALLVELNTQYLTSNNNYYGIEGDQQNNQYPALDSAKPSLLAKICSFFWWTGKGAKVEPRGDESNIGEVKNEKSDEADFVASSEKPAPVAQPKTSWWNPFSWLTSWWSGSGVKAENQDHVSIEGGASCVAVKNMFSSPKLNAMNESNLDAPEVLGKGFCGMESSFSDGQLLLTDHSQLLLKQ